MKNDAAEKKEIIAGIAASITMDGKKTRTTLVHYPTHITQVFIKYGCFNHFLHTIQKSDPTLSAHIPPVINRTPLAPRLRKTRKRTTPAESMFVLIDLRR